jgi:hypothetical protein
MKTTSRKQSKMSDEELIKYSKNLRKSVSSIIEAIHTENIISKDCHE